MAPREARVGEFNPLRRLGMISRIIVVAVLLFWLVVQIYPVLYLFSTSLKSDVQLLNEPFALPDPIRLDNYQRVWDGDRSNQGYPIYLRNSLITTAGTLALLLAVSSLAGYALARGKFP